MRGSQEPTSGIAVKFSIHVQLIENPIGVHPWALSRIGEQEN